MSSLSSSTSNHEIFLYDKEEGEAVNGFVAGLAGSALHDEPDINGPVGATKQRTIRLSANSGSYEELEFQASHPSITEESSCNLDSDFEMRVSDGESHYASRFSLMLNFSDVMNEESETTLEVTNSSTIDATLENNGFEKREVEREVDEEEESGVGEREGDSVFSPVDSSSFGEFQAKKESRHGSDSSFDSFGDFDDGPWVSPAGTSGEMTSLQHVVTSPELVSREEVEPVTEQCFSPSSPTSLVLHSSPKKLLDSNFVWVQARSNVTKPSYSWDKLKLHSYLLGALSVRQPISLNRLKPAGSVSTSEMMTSSRYVAGRVASSASSPSSSSFSPSQACSSPTPSSPDLASSSPDLACPGDAELGELATASYVQSEKEECNSNLSLSPDIPVVTSDTNIIPSLSNFIHRKLTSHRRTHSSPIPSVKPVSPGRRSLSNSPSTAVRGITKCNSLESPLSPLSSPSSPASFDETHAGRGLSLLSLPDILTMKQEMKSRVSELSATLITEFQYRGDADHSKEVKKAFVSAFLSAEEKKSKGQLSSKQKSLLPIVCNEHCPPTEILVLLTQLLNGLINDTPHTAELLKHYMYMLCKPCLDN